MTKVKAPRMPTEVQIWNLSSTFFSWSRCSQDFPLWASKSLNTVRIMSSFILRISRLWCSHYHANIKIIPYQINTLNMPSTFVLHNFFSIYSFHFCSHYPWQTAILSCLDNHIRVFWRVSAAPVCSIVHTNWNSSNMIYINITKRYIFVTHETCNLDFMQFSSSAALFYHLAPLTYFFPHSYLGFV